MLTQITLVGLGQIGGSIGLALSGRADILQRVGHDRELGIARRAEKMGVVDRVAINLISAVREADIILLALPVDQVRETLVAIAKDIKEGAVVLDTGPVKEAVAAWAGELLPPGRYYVGLTPALNPIYLHTAEAGLDAAHADLFHAGLLAIIAPPRTPSEAIKVAVDLTQLLGAMPFFVDMAEVDSLMAATHLLPQLLGAGLLNATVDRPGWREARKLAGQAYAQVTASLENLDGSAALGSGALLGRENVLRLLDGVIAELEALREAIARQDPAALQSLLNRAEKGRARWWKQRQMANWAAEETSSAVDAPTTGEVLGRMIGIGRPKKKPKQDET